MAGSSLPVRCEVLIHQRGHGENGVAAGHGCGLGQLTPGLQSARRATAWTEAWLGRAAAHRLVADPWQHSGGHPSARTSPGGAGRRHMEVSAQLCGAGRGSRPAGRTDLNGTHLQRQAADGGRMHAGRHPRPWRRLHLRGDPRMQAGRGQWFALVPPRLQAQFWMSRSSRNPARPAVLLGPRLAPHPPTASTASASELASWSLVVPLVGD